MRVRLPALGSSSALEVRGGEIRKATAEELRRGTGMVTPLDPLTLRLYDGGTEAIYPGKDRLSPIHDAVRERPDLFRPCDLEDKRTVARMREAVARYERNRAGGPRSGRKPWRLGSEPRREWKLP
jgi:hypothetical protein